MKLSHILTFASILGGAMLAGCGSVGHGAADPAASEKYPDYTTEWYDTLTNASSDLAALRPMDTEIECFMAKWGLHGLSLAVTRNDSLLYARGFGWADEEAGEPMKPTTGVRIASASKLVTAVAIMKMCRDSLLTLDMPVFGPKGVLNDTAYTGVITDDRIYDITVDHLLTHTAGFSTRAGDPMFSQLDLMKNHKLASAPRFGNLASLIISRRLAAEPGTVYSYSNFGYMLLSLVIEKVTGKSYWDFVQESVLAPIGAGGFHAAGNYYADRAPDEARYYAPDDKLVDEFNGSGRQVPRVYGGADIEGLMGGGGWVASAPGLARLVAAIDGIDGVRDIFGAGTVAMMTEYDSIQPRARGWSHVTDDGAWVRTGTLYSSHVLIKQFPDGECWVMSTNTGVWIGYRFAASMSALTDRLREEFGSMLPRRNLF